MREIGAGACALAAALGIGVVGVMAGDDGTLPAGGVATAASVAPIDPPGVAAKRAAARGRIDRVEPSDDLKWPVHGAVTGRFGEGRGGHVHEGLDVPMPEGTPIKAAANGTVVMREMQDGYGRYTCIAHSRITTCYGHQSRFHTTLGAHVKQGQVIGYVGNSGNSPAIHLHFEVRRGTRPWGTAVNPAKFLPR